MSPRTGSAKASYAAKDTIASITGDADWEVCGCSLRIYSLPTYKDVGHCERATGMWKWDNEALSAAGCARPPPRDGAGGDAQRDAPPLL